jgi:N-acetylneuraminate synthase
MNPSTVVKIGDKKIGPGYPIFVVAEVGSNHNRELSLAKQLIDAAADAGADAVKFQLFKAEWLYPPNCGIVDTPMGAVEFYEILEKYALPEEWLPELNTYAEKRNIIFLCTPFDEAAVDYLATLNIHAFKIASPELNHLPLIKAIAKYRKPILCSTGLSLLEDVEEAANHIYSVWPEAALILLHCVSSYPLVKEQANLKVIQTLKNMFNVPIGFSDHTTDPEVVPTVACAMGACLIEKHYTLDRSFFGPDHKFALEPDELGAMIKCLKEIERVEPDDRSKWVCNRFGIHKVETLLGHGRKEIMPAESELYPNDKRSIHTIKTICAGEPMSPHNIRILRSERNLSPGLHPRHWEKVLGTKASQDIDLGAGLQWQHLFDIG